MASVFCESDSFPLGLDDFTSKQYSTIESMEKDGETEFNGHQYEGVNGNGVHEEFNNDLEDNDDIDEGKNKNGERVINGYGAGNTYEETTDESSAEPLPYYGKTLVAPEYLNFQLAGDSSNTKENENEDEKENDNNRTEEEVRSAEPDFTLAGQDASHIYEDVCDLEDELIEEEEKESASDQRKNVTGKEGNEMLEDSPLILQPEKEDGQDFEAEVEMEEMDSYGDEDDRRNEDAIEMEMNANGNDEENEEEEEEESEEEEEEEEGESEEEDGAQQGDEITEVNETEACDNSEKGEGLEGEDKREEETSEADEIKQGETNEGDESNRYEHDGDEELDEEEKDEDVSPDEEIQGVADKDDGSEESITGGACYDKEDNSELDGDFEGQENEDRIPEKNVEYGNKDGEVVVKQNGEEDLALDDQDENLVEPPKPADIDDIQNDGADEVDVAFRKESNFEHCDSLKLNVESPTRDMVAVASVEFLNEVEGEDKEVEDNERQDDHREDPTSEEESTRKPEEQNGPKTVTTNGSVEESETQLLNQGMEGLEDYFEPQNESCPSDDSAEDESQEGESIADDDDDVGKLEPVPEENGAESDEETKDEVTFVVRHQKGPDDDSDLSGRVKELGKMFEGGGPVFPKTAKSDNDKADGTPVSVRKYKAMFEQDRYCAEQARSAGRKDELSGPPRGIVKNMRGVFEKSQGLESRTG